MTSSTATCAAAVQGAGATPQACTPYSRRTSGFDTSSPSIRSPSGGAAGTHRDSLVRV